MGSSGREERACSLHDTTVCTAPLPHAGEVSIYRRPRGGLEHMLHCFQKGLGLLEILLCLGRGPWKSVT